MTTGHEAVGSLGPGQGSLHAGAPLSGVRPADGAGRPARPPRRRASADRRLGLALIAPAIIALSLVTVFPLIYNLWNSFHTDQLANPAAGKGFSGLQNYRELFSQPGFTADFVHTAFFTVVSVGIEMCLGLAIAVVISKPYRGRGFVRAAILVPWAVPTVVSAMLWKTMVDPQSGFVNYLLKTFHLPGANLAWSAQTWSSWAVVIVSDAWKTTPLVAIILLAGLQAIPADVYEAAQVDGAGAWRRFTRITLPLLKPALLVPYPGCVPGVRRYLYLDWWRTWVVHGNPWLFELEGLSRRHRFRLWGGCFGEPDPYGVAHRLRLPPAHQAQHLGGTSAWLRYR